MSGRARALPRLVLATLLLLALFVPWMFENQFGLYLLDMALINAVIALGLNVVLKTGQVSMAQAGFMAIGAYTSAQLTVKLDVPFLVGFVAAGLGAALVALGLGRIILRLKGVYFLLFTFALNEFLYLLNKNVPALTGGNDGVVGIKPPTIPLVADPLRSKAAFYYLVLVVVALALAFVWALYRSPFGRAMDAVRESELLAAATGYNPMRIKIIAFSIGCLLAGLGGSLYAHFLLYIAPFSFTFWESVNFLLMNIIGGSTSLAGPILGALILTPLPELLRAYVMWQQVLYGLTFMVFMRFLPDGVTPLCGSAWRAAAGLLGLQAGERAPDPRSGS
ncbi:MAG: branched-chain amino acid ABC transporter permease [Candidatus Rokubacteria bacterium]|nr:branched-chain amino acid ABC transporter permease [Candidatus Rokubacteria bacterium]